jgi:hypothetical protein
MLPEPDLNRAVDGHPPVTAFDRDALRWVR